MSEQTLQVRQLTDAQLDQFIQFPFDLYDGSPYWVGDLKADTKLLLSPKNTFWTHARRALFMAYRGNKAVGRICALVNDAHNQFHNENIGFFGFFDSINDADVSHALFQAAEQWLKAQGVDAVRGPANPSSNHTYGLLLNGFDSAPAIMMPYNYPYYPALIDKEGFEKAKDLLAFSRTRKDKFTPLFEKVVERAGKCEGLTLRPLNLGKIYEEAEIIREIYNKSWADNWGFVPLTQQEMKDMAGELKLIVKPQGTCIAEIDGKPAGFYIAIPNMNHALKVLNGSISNPMRLLRAFMVWRKIRDARLMMLGVMPEFRKRGIDLVLIKHIVEHGIAIWDEAELSWILEDNQGMIRGMVEAGCKPIKRYRVYQKTL